MSLMGAYTGLLLDQLVHLDGGRLINIGAQTVPESVLTYYGDRNRETLRQATIDFVNSTVLPKALKHRQEDLHRPAAIFLRDSKCLFWQNQEASVATIIQTTRNDFKKGMGGCEGDVLKFVKQLTSRYQNQSPDLAIIEIIEQEIEAFIEDYDERNRKLKKSITSTARTNLELLVTQLETAANQPQVEIPTDVSISAAQIVSWLNDLSQSQLIIIQAHDPDALEEFASMLSNIAYESRRRTGQITPLAFFIFDEADEFIPGHAGSDNQKMTKAAVMTLARRGRKFGLGIGIATQRIANLDVNTLAQPHTYFVSKLLRQYDRQAIADAFGISEDMFRQTFKFKKGDWLLAS